MRSTLKHFEPSLGPNGDYLTIYDKLPEPDATTQLKPFYTNPEKTEFKVMGLCNNCAAWNELTVSTDNYGDVFHNQTCSECGSKNWDIQSAISLRTFSTERAKIRARDRLKVIKNQLRSQQ